jgi:hypothetical protein
MFKKDFQQGRSERRGKAYSLSYVELLSDARTKLEDFFNILLVRRFTACITHLRKVLLAEDSRLVGVVFEFE